MDLDQFFRINRKAAIAFSGGVDSAYLLYSAVRCAADVTAYYVRTAFQPSFELEDARRLAEETGAELKIIDADVLSVPEIASNPPDRCYHCKKLIMSTIAAAAAEDGYTVILDGTNASDDVSDRPGMKALSELGVLSPLRECGLGKDEIRRLSREAGLFTWNKSAYACLATRMPVTVPLDEEKLRKTEEAEDFLHSLGFCDFRVRFFHGAARIQICREQIPLLVEKRTAIADALRGSYDAVLFDLEARDE